MGFPQFPEKFAKAAVFGADELIAYRRRLGRLPDLPGLEGVLMCLERGLPRRLRWRIPVRLAGNMNGEVYAPRKSGGRVAIMTGFGGGAPMTAELAEEFAAMGAKKILLMTWGGALQPDLRSGDVVVCDEAVRDEGTSHHYLPPARTVRASAELAQGLAGAIRAKGWDCRVGCTWTTDAPYRETLEEVRQYQAEGVATVEMESAGLFAIGETRGIQTASVVVVMDRLASLRWEVPDSLERISRSLETVYAAALDVLAGKA